MEQKFISVFPDLACQIHEAPITEYDQPPLFIARYVSKMISFKPNRYTYHIYDGNKRLTELTCDGWRIQSDTIEHYHHYTDRLEFDVIDPTGNSRAQLINTPISIEAIIELHKHINQFKGFMNWNHYDVYVENGSLRNELEALKSIINIKP